MLQAPAQTGDKDPYAAFASVFDHFATAEEVTGAVQMQPDEDAEEYEEADEAPEAAPAVVRPPMRTS